MSMYDTQRSLDVSTMTETDSHELNAKGQGDDVPSPCINVCAVHPSTGWCLGCYRALEEIAGWRDFSSEEKRAVLARLPARQRPAAATDCFERSGKL